MSEPLYKLKGEFFKTLGHPARIRILELLSVRDRSVAELLREVGLESSNLSQQLGVLRRTGVVAASKDGNSVIYSIASPNIAELLAVARKVCQPTSWVADRFVRAQPSITVLPARGFAMDRETFDRWAQTQPTLLLGNFYRDARRRFGVLMDGAQPAGSRWNFDEANRKPSPKGSACLNVADPWLPEEDEIDEQVRAT